jgi:hypothetical protein
VLLDPRPVQPSTVLARSRTLRAGSAGAAVATSLTAAARGALPEGKVGTMGWSLSIEQRDVAFALSSASPSHDQFAELDAHNCTSSPMPGRRLRSSGLSTERTSHADYCRLLGLRRHLGVPSELLARPEPGTSRFRGIGPRSPVRRRCCGPPLALPLCYPGLALAAAPGGPPGLAMGGGRPARRRFTVEGSGKSVARCHRTVLAYWKFESISLQRRVCELSVPEHHAAQSGRRRPLTGIRPLRAGEAVSPVVGAPVADPDKGDDEPPM